jgi:hypothetical protein
MRARGIWGSPREKAYIGCGLALSQFPQPEK